MLPATKKKSFKEIWSFFLNTLQILYLHHLDARANRDERAAVFDIVRAPTKSNSDHIRIISSSNTFDSRR
jgi:hypothetical protein